MAMKLDTALKLYMALYVVCFGLTWLVSVPMLIHVSPRSECLLFVDRWMKYGSPSVCQLVGFLPILVAACALVLLVLHAVQLRNLRRYLRTPGPHSSKNFSRPPHIFWRVVVFHGVVTLLLLAVVAIVTAGYSETCQNLYREVRTIVRSRIQTDRFGSNVEVTNDNHDIFADDRSINRYTNNFRDSYGQSAYEAGITCRNILTDPYVHSKLKENHELNPYYRDRAGSWYSHETGASRANIYEEAYQDNTIMELCLAGSWICFAVWLIIFILMVTMRHHLKAHITDESVFGSEFGGSVRSRSRMSNQSFDKMSQSRYSNYSGSQMSHGSRGSRPRSNRSPGRSHPGNASRNQGYTPTRHTQPPREALIPERPAAGKYQDNLLNYFASDPPVEDEVDVDAALDNHIMDARQNGNPGYQQQESLTQQMERQPADLNDFQDNSGLDTSFELPVAVDQADALHGGPPPLGDDVSEGNFTPQPGSIQMQPYSNGYDHEEPRRETGRRGRRSDGYNAMAPTGNSRNTVSAFRQEPNGDLVYEHQEQMRQTERFESIQPAATSEPRQTGRRGAYRTTLGNQSMI